MVEGYTHAQMQSCNRVLAHNLGWPATAIKSVPNDKSAALLVAGKRFHGTDLKLLVLILNGLGAQLHTKAQTVRGRHRYKLVGSRISTRYLAGTTEWEAACELLILLTAHLYKRDFAKLRQQHLASRT
jgi:hypothetical protein